MNSVSSLPKVDINTTYDKPINSSFSQISINCDGEQFAPTNCGNNEKNLFYKFSVINNKSVIEFKYKNKTFIHSLNESIVELGINSFLFENESKMILIIDSFLEYGHTFYVYLITADNIKFIATTNFDSKFDNNEIELMYRFNISENDNSVIIKLGNGYDDIKLLNISNSYTLPLKKNILSNPKSNINLIGKWTTNGCENPIGITINEKGDMVMCVNPNQYYIHLSSIKGSLKYKLNSFEGIGSQDVASDVYLNDKAIVEIQILDDNKIEFKWLGFYNKINNQRQYTEQLIANENPVILNKCN
jgi:hypothetical protein